MSKEKIQEASLIPQIFIDRPPEYEAVEVTRENIDLVADWMRCRETVIKRSQGVISEVTFNIVDAIDRRGEMVDHLTVEFRHEPDATHFLRQYIIRGSSYIYKLVTLTTLETKYIQIPQEASIIE